ncbi:hypothetical protein LC724_13220 [Blautia sp. RD014234]|nr:hypothetical protein [Blautia parvula]
MAGNIQADAVWTLGLTEEEIKDAGLVKGRDLIVYEEDREEKSISLAYTKSMETADIEKLEKAFQNIDTAKIQGHMPAMPPKGITRKESPAFILGSFSALFCFPLPYLYFSCVLLAKKASDGADGI